jgi:hypothetical protein
MRFSNAFNIAEAMLVVKMDTNYGLLSDDYDIFEESFKDGDLVFKKQPAEDIKILSIASCHYLHFTVKFQHLFN